MRLALLALAVLLAAPAGAASSHRVRRGDMEIKVKITGTVVPDELFRIKAIIEGRVENVMTSTYVWKSPGDTLAFLAHKELAAMLDARGAQDKDILEDRWQRVYKPTPVRCPETCYILRVYTQAKTWVKPQAVLIEAARSLKLVARVRPEDAQWIRDGQEMTFWAVSEPAKKYKAKISGFVLDIQGRRVEPGGSFTLELSPDRFFAPGTEWEGEVIAASKKDVIMVPTAALLHLDGAVYLPVRVSTGLTTLSLTQVTAGVGDKREILVIDDSQLQGVERHKQGVDAEALRARQRELKAANEPPPPAEPKPAPRKTAPVPAYEPDLPVIEQPVRKRGRHAEVIEDDPYAEP